MPLGWSSSVACCPNCRHELRVSVTSPGKCHAPHTPPPFTIQPYLPHYTTPAVPLTPAYNDELRRLADTLKALRLSGWYYGGLDWQVRLLHYQPRSPLRDIGWNKFPERTILSFLLYFLQYVVDGTSWIKFYWFKKSV